MKMCQDGAGTVPELETGTVRTVFPRNETEPEPFVQEPKPELELSFSFKLIRNTEGPSPLEELSELKAETARTAPGRSSPPLCSQPLRGLNCAIVVL